MPTKTKMEKVTIWSFCAFRVRDGVSEALAITRGGKQVEIEWPDDKVSVCRTTKAVQRAYENFKKREC